MKKSYSYDPASRRVCGLQCNEDDLDLDGAHVFQV